MDRSITTGARRTIFHFSFKFCSVKSVCKQPAVVDIVNHNEPVLNFIEVFKAFKGPLWMKFDLVGAPLYNQTEIELLSRIIIRSERKSFRVALKWFFGSQKKGSVEKYRITASSINKTTSCPLIFNSFGMQQLLSQFLSHVTQRLASLPKCLPKVKHFDVKRQRPRKCFYMFCD